MHSTKLDLRVWIAAIFLVLTSRKGICSVVMSQILGVNQKTAWKLGHAIRELMADREGIASQLGGIPRRDPEALQPSPASREGPAETDEIRRKDSHDNNVEANTCRRTDERASLLCDWPANAPHA